MADPRPPSRWDYLRPWLAHISDGLMSVGMAMGCFPGWPGAPWTKNGAARHSDEPTDRGVAASRQPDSGVDGAPLTPTERDTWFRLTDDLRATDGFSGNVPS